MGESREMVRRQGKPGPMIARCWSCGQVYEARALCEKCPPCRGRQRGEEAPLPGLKRSQS